MKEAKSQLNNSARVIEDAQTAIRIAVKTAFLRNYSKALLEYRVGKIINEAVQQIPLKRLASDAKQSLRAFANRQYKTWKSLKMSASLIAFIGMQASKDFPYKTKPTTDTERRLVKELTEFTANDRTGLKTKIKASFETDAKGVPLNTYYKQVWKDKVKPTLDKLMNEVALDPSDYTGRNSLRNLAEMEVRYNNHLKEIDDLKKAGVKLVVASSHADCSGRCAKWQGRVYSLDGSTGVTESGHKYVPLEMATDVYYVTKAGRVYKNGLLGFNCRHRLEEYKGAPLPTISAKDRKREYDITLRQRELERAVRRKRVEALMLKDIDERGYKEATAKAKALYGEYKRFCHENERAYYPMRVAI